MKIKQFNTIHLGKKLLSEIYEMHPEINSMQEIIDHLKGVKNQTPDIISRAISEGSILMVNISQVVAEYVSLANESYTYRKYAEMWEFNKLKSDVSQKAREHIARDAVFEETQNELTARFVADFLKNTEKSYYTFITTMQSRLNVLKQERINS